MDSPRESGRLTGAVVVGLCALVGLAVAGFFIGRGTERLRSAVRTVTVKGLVEKEVKADRAIWTLNLRRASADVKDAQARIASDREAAVGVSQEAGVRGLRDRADSDQDHRQARPGVRPAAGRRSPALHPDGLARVTTPKVDLVRSSLGATDELLRSGVVLDGGDGGSPANPRFVVSAFNDLRPQLLAERHEERPGDGPAVRGRLGGAGREHPFGQSGADPDLRDRRQRRVGSVFADEHGQKKIRVVSTFEFALE